MHPTLQQLFEEWTCCRDRSVLLGSKEHANRARESDVQGASTLPCLKIVYHGLGTGDQSGMRQYLRLAFTEIPTRDFHRQRNVLYQPESMQGTDPGKAGVDASARKYL